MTNETKQSDRSTLNASEMETEQKTEKARSAQILARVKAESDAPLDRLFESHNRVHVVRAALLKTARQAVRNPDGLDINAFLAELSGLFDAEEIAVAELSEALAYTRSK